MSTSSTTTLPGTRTSSATTSLVSAALLGVVIVFATGFSYASVAHNASHDVRHSNAFPCH